MQATGTYERRAMAIRIKGLQRHLSERRLEVTGKRADAHELPQEGVGQHTVVHDTLVHWVNTHSG